METWSKRQVVFRGRIFEVISGEVALDDGSPAQRDVVVHPGGVGVVPILDGDLLLVRQYRVAVGEHLLEIPAGKLEGDEDPALRAALECEEETGYRPGRLEPLADFYVSPGYVTERLRLYLARNLVHVGARPEHDERIELVRLSPEEVRAGLESGAFRDAKTIIGLRAALALLFAG